MVYIVIWCIWLTHVSVAALLTAPIAYVARNQVRWRYWELLAFILPFLSWLLFSMFSRAAPYKGWPHLAVPFVLSLLIPIAALVRVGLSKTFSEVACSCMLLWVLCVVAACLFVLLPPLGA